MRILFIRFLTICFFCSLSLLFPSCNEHSQLAGAQAKNNAGAQGKNSTQSSSNWQEDVNELNQKIVILSRWQQGYRMTAQQAQFKADRIQFQQENISDAKRLWKVAENASQKAQDLQVIINKLVEQRNAILNRHGQPIPKDAGYENKNSLEEQES